MLLHLVCPVSFDQVDSNASRLTVFFNTVLMTVFMFALQPVLLYVVSVDYFIRACGLKKYSPIAFVSQKIVRALEMKPVMIDVAQKTFASRLGFACALFGTIFILNDMPIASMIVIGFFMVLATLDSIFDLCVGCLIYNNLVFPLLGHLHRKNTSRQ